MAWLQSSFTNHQLIGESKSNNLRKGYKVGSLNKNSDPDKSETPLLLDGPLLDLRSESDVTDPCDSASVSEPKKTNSLHNIPSKPGFLSSNFFDRSSGVVKTKPLPDVSSPTHTAQSPFVSKPKESKNLLSFGKCDKPQVEVEEDDDEDSDDEWFSPHASRGYQRVKTGAD